MPFATGIEKKIRMFLLDVQIIREDKKFTYRKPTFSGIHTRFKSLQIWYC